MKFKQEFSSNSLKYFKIIDSNFYFLESAYNSSWRNDHNNSSSSSLSVNIFDYHLLKKISLLNYSESSNNYNGNITKSGYLPNISEIFPTFDSKVLLIRMDKTYLKFDTASKIFIDSFKINSYYSIDNLLNDKLNFVCYDSSKFTFYNIKTMMKINTLICPINAISYKIHTDGNRLLCWNTKGEVVLQNIYSNEKYAKISADKYYENPNKEIKFSYFSNINSQQAEWDFGDGNKSVEEFPTHKYNNKGSYQVSLRIRDKNGNWFSSSMGKKIEIKDKLIADFEFKINSNQSPADVYFYDKSMGEPLYYKWTTSQGDTSYYQNPFFTFKNPGYYTVKLVINDEFQTDSLVKEECVIIDYGEIDTLNEVKNFNVPYINETFGSIHRTLNAILHSKVFCFKNGTVGTNFNYQILSKNIYQGNGSFSYENHYFIVQPTGKLDTPAVKVSIQINEIIQIFDDKVFSITKPKNVFLHNSNLQELKKLATYDSIDNAYHIGNLIYVVTKNPIVLYDENFELISQFKPYQKPIHIINGENHKLKILVSKSDSLFLQSIDEQNVQDEKFLINFNANYKNYKFKNLPDNRFVFFGSVKINNQDYGFFKLFDENGILLKEEIYYDIALIDNIDKTDNKLYYITYQTRNKNEVGVILVNNEFEREYKFKYFHNEPDYNHQSTTYYKDDLFFVTGFVKNPSGSVSPILKLLSTNTNVISVEEKSILIDNSPLLSPNPASDFININQAGIKNLKIYDLNGIELDCDAEYFENIVRVNTFELQTGIYFVRYEINSKIYFEKFVKI